MKVAPCLWAAVTFVPAAYLSLLYLYEVGDWVMVLSVFLIVWGADISAYFCGRAWGKHKMAPAISPNKTIEGAVGAYVIVIVFFLLTYWFCVQENVFTNLSSTTSASSGASSSSRASLRSRSPGTCGNRC